MVRAPGSGHDVLGTGVKEKDLSRSLRENIVPLYEKHAESMREELHEFRASERFSAVYFNPTGMCNAACRYCYLPDDLRRTGKHMSYQEISTALDNLHEFFENYPGSVMRNSEGKRPVIVFHGSEPLLVKDALKKIVVDYLISLCSGSRPMAAFDDDTTTFSDNAQ